METTKTKRTKTSIVGNAAWVAALDAATVISQIVILIKRQINFAAEDYLTPIPIPILMTAIPLIVMILLLIVTIVNAIKTEKEDELSKINRYKAGYISKYVCLGVIIIGICIIKNFEFAFQGDFIDNISLPIVIFAFEQFVENITFIILEKSY